MNWVTDICLQTSRTYDASRSTDFTSKSSITIQNTTILPSEPFLHSFNTRSNSPHSFSTFYTHFQPFPFALNTFLSSQLAFSLPHILYHLRHILDLIQRVFETYTGFQTSTLIFDLLHPFSTISIRSQHLPLVPTRLQQPSHILEPSHLPATRLQATAHISECFWHIPTRLRLNRSNTGPGHSDVLWVPLTRYQSPCTSSVHTVEPADAAPTVFESFYSFPTTCLVLNHSNPSSSATACPHTFPTTVDLSDPLSTGLETHRPFSSSYIHFRPSTYIFK